jgi:hypothetical protein
MTDTDLLTLIRAQPTLRALADAGSDYALAAAVPALATMTVLRPFGAAEIIGPVAAANRAKVVSSPIFSDIQAAIVAQDRTALGFHAQLCVDAGFITTAEQATINAVLVQTETVPDTSVDHTQVSRVLATIRPKDADGTVRATPIAW